MKHKYVSPEVEIFKFSLTTNVLAKSNENENIIGSNEYEASKDPFE